MLTSSFLQSLISHLMAKTDLTMICASPLYVWNSLSHYQASKIIQDSRQPVFLLRARTKQSELSHLEILLDIL